MVVHLLVLGQERGNIPSGPWVVRLDKYPFSAPRLVLPRWKGKLLIVVIMKAEATLS